MLLHGGVRRLNYLMILLIIRCNVIAPCIWKLIDSSSNRNWMKTIPELPIIKPKDQLALVLTKVLSSQNFSKFIGNLAMCGSMHQLKGYSNI